MSRLKGRDKLIKKLLLESVVNIIWARDSVEVNNELVYCSEQVLSLLKHRYIGPRDIKLPKSSDWYLFILPQYDDKRFKSCLRVTRNNFATLLGIVSVSKVFKNKIIPAEKQLAIALYRFGCNGSGVSWKKIGQQFGISDGGTICNSTNRVIQALIAIEANVISWPSLEERRLIQNSMENKLPGCIGYVDGCHIPLFEAPLDHHESYFSRKQQYGIQLQAVCDNQLQIRNLTVGYPASAHDARVFANSPIGMLPDRFFISGQWIAGDSAYKLTETVLTPFRDNSNYGTAAQRRKFNQHFSSYRVYVERTFGILKKVFGSLRSLRIRVDKESGHRRACEWIRACCIVYNIIRPFDEELEFECEESQDEVVVEDYTIQGEERRKLLFNWINHI